MPLLLFDYDKPIVILSSYHVALTTLTLSELFVAQSFFGSLSHVIH